MTTILLNQFMKWIDKHLSQVKSLNVKAFNFNLYESNEENEYDIQLVGSPYYDSENDDWACDTIFSSEEDLFTINSDDWETALEQCIELVKEYSNSGELKHIFLNAERVTAGFVDGDLEIIL